MGGASCLRWTAYGEPKTSRVRRPLHHSLSCQAAGSSTRTSSRRTCCSAATGSRRSPTTASPPFRPRRRPTRGRAATSPRSTAAAASSARRSRAARRRTTRPSRCAMDDSIKSLTHSWRGKRIIDRVRRETPSSPPSSDDPPPRARTHALTRPSSLRACPKRTQAWLANEVRKLPSAAARTAFKAEKWPLTPATSDLFQVWRIAPAHGLPHPVPYELALPTPFLSMGVCCRAIGSFPTASTSHDAGGAVPKRATALSF